MRDALNNASFIGFTGTPIAQEDKDTRAVFGEYVSVYDIQDAVDDGATVPIYYESRLAKLDLNHAEINELSEQVEELVEDDEDVGTREKTKGEWSRLEKLVGATSRLKQVATDLVAHFETRTESMDGKAMIVGMSRDICAHLYNEIRCAARSMKPKSCVRKSHFIRRLKPLYRSSPLLIENAARKRRIPRLSKFWIMPLLPKA